MKETKDIKWVYLGYSIVWISVSIAICFSIYYTKSFWGLLAFGFLGMPSVNSKNENNDIREKEDEEYE